MVRIRSFSLVIAFVITLSLLPAVRVAVAQPATEDVKVNTTAVGGAPADIQPAELRRLGEVAAMRGPRSKTLELSDGSFETVISAAPVHVTDGRGTLREKKQHARLWKRPLSRIRRAKVGLLAHD